MESRVTETDRGARASDIQAASRDVSGTRERAASSSQSMTPNMRFAKLERIWRIAQDMCLTG